MRYNPPSKPRLMEKGKLVFATHNDHKLMEVKEILKESGFQIESLNSLGFHDEIPETGATLQENADIKSSAIHHLLKVNVFSDDSGLEVMALDMQPGVHTARYAGPQKDAHDNMDKLLEALKEESDRRARFRTVICLILKGQKHFFEGIVNGYIAVAKRGEGGFGYDPVFLPEGYDMSFAEMHPDEKNKISHRYRAIQKMKTFLAEIKNAEGNASSGA